MYVGSAKERQRLHGKLRSFDVVITSYEVVRNDIATLQDVDWHYCILDEDHIIKNAENQIDKGSKVHPGASQGPSFGHPDPEQHP